MGVVYKPVLWNRQKRRYDRTFLALIGLFWLAFIGSTLYWHPQITAETLIIRTTGLTAILMLHIILLIGPLARLDKRFLPLLYNRRHLGVTMFLIALVHAVFSIFQFHALGDTNPFISIFTANEEYLIWPQFPFQVFGFFALLILFLMAASSHDFWLHNLGPRFWKSMHMNVYRAYALLVLHVLLGILQLEKANFNYIVLGIGVATVCGFHLAAALRSRRATGRPTGAAADFYEVCDLRDIPEDRAKVVLIKDQNIAIFKYEGKLSAINNVCKHQNGPLGEGKVVDGCVTCPWHGYQYYPHNGSSPPPFSEKVSTYDLELRGSTVWVNPQPYPEGTERPPVQIPAIFQTPKTEV
ncbi:MAG: ferric reductase-like transmembrane domain-containing protein [Phaeodactylibacter sp.]|nr:ferric reductase-like transmembrane domain-containing protein [Phaeodactylibacter sp.]